MHNKKLHVKSAMIRRILFTILCILSTPSILPFDNAFNAIKNNLKALLTPSFNCWITTTTYIKKEYPELALYHIKCLDQGPTGCNVHAFRNGLYLLAMAHNPRLGKQLYKEMLNVNLYTLFAATLGFTSDNLETYTAFTKAQSALNNNSFEITQQKCIPQNSLEVLPKIVKINPYITSNAETKASFLTLNSLEIKKKFYADLIQKYEKIDSHIAEEYAYYAAFLPRYDFIDPQFIQNMESFNSHKNYSFCCIFYPYILQPHAVALLLTKNNGISSYYFADSATKNWEFGPSKNSWKNTWYTSQMFCIKQLIAFSNSYELCKESLIRNACLYALTQQSDKAKTVLPEVLKFLSTHNLDNEPLYTQYYKQYLQ